MITTETRNCRRDVCGNSFPVYWHNRTKVYCSATCANEARRRPADEKFCVTCKVQIRRRRKEGGPAWARRLYCSRKCSGMNHTIDQDRTLVLDLLPPPKGGVSRRFLSSLTDIPQGTLEKIELRALRKLAERLEQTKAVDW